MKRLEFEVEDNTYYVTKPTPKQLTLAKGRENRTFAEAVENKAFLRVQIKDILKDRGIWTEEKETKLSNLDKDIEDGVRKLKRGGMKKSDAKQLAFDIRDWRFARLNLMSDIHEYNNYCAESQADNANFDFLVSACTVTEDGSPVFESYDDYKERSTEPVAFVAAEKLAELMFGYDKNADKKLPENQFLIKYGFVNEELRFIDKDGNLTDRGGRKVNDLGYYFRDDGNFEDASGNVYDKEGKPVEEFVEFTEE